MTDVFDVFARMDAAISEAADCADPAAVVASRLVERLSQEDPDLLRQWLDQMATTTMHRAISRHDRSRRAWMRKITPVSVFARAAENGELGDWLEARYTADATGARKRLGDMTRRDLEFMITRLRTAQDRLETEARFLERILSKLGDDDTVASVLTSAQISSLRVAS